MVRYCKVQKASLLSVKQEAKETVAFNLCHIYVHGPYTVPVHKPQNVFHPYHNTVTGSNEVRDQERLCDTHTHL